MFMDENHSSKSDEPNITITPFHWKTSYTLLRIYSNFFIEIELKYLFDCDYHWSVLHLCSNKPVILYHLIKQYAVEVSTGFLSSNWVAPKYLKLILSNNATKLTSGFENSFILNWK